MSGFNQLMMRNKFSGSGYQQASYIQSVGTRAINTEIYPDDTTIIQCKFVMTNYGGGYFIGNNTGNERDAFRFFRYNYLTYLDYGAGDNYNRISASYIISTSTIYEVEIGNRYIKNLLNNTIVKSATSVTFSQKTYQIRLFSSVDYGKCYYLKIYKNNTLVSDLEPVYDLSTGKYGMFNNVDGTFNGGFGSGDFLGELS